jgi:hypothetical protein
VLSPCREASCRAPKIGDVLIGVGESVVRVIALVPRLFDLLYFIAEVGRQKRHPSLDIQYRGAVWTRVQPCSVSEPPGGEQDSMKEPYSWGVK